TSVLSPGVRVHSWSHVAGSVLMDDAEVGRHATVRNAILDKSVIVEEGASVGVDPQLDRDRGFTVTDSGVAVVAKKGRVTAQWPHRPCPPCRYSCWCWTSTPRSSRVSRSICWPGVPDRAPWSLRSPNVPCRAN